MRLFTRRGKCVLMFAMLFLTLFGFGASVFAQEMEKPGVAVYVVGGIPENEKKVLGSYLLAAIVNSGQGVGAEYADAFLAAAMGEERAKPDGVLSVSRVCELGRHYRIRYICVASVTAAFDFFVVSTRMVDTEMEKTVLKGEAQSPLKTMGDLTQVSNKIVESMFGVTIPEAQPKPEPGTASSQSAVVGAASGAPPTVVSVAGDAKVVVDRVVAAVNAFKDATSKSIAAANAVKTAAQSKNFSAIMDAKKKVESAAAAVKKAKADVTAAIEVLNSSGPEAVAAVKALGIDLSMFGGSADNDGEEDEYDDGEGSARFYFAPKYMLPVGTPASWGGINLEIGWVWRNGVLFGIDLNYGNSGNGGLFGGGLSVGREIDLGNQMQLVIGGSAGFWFTGGREYYEYYNTYSGRYEEAYWYNYSYNFLAPFVKWRWSALEVTYRGLLGIYDNNVGGDYIYDNYYDYGFGYNSHQIMVGYYLKTKGKSNREKNAWFYFAPKYQTPVGAPTSWGGVNMELGWVWRNGVFFGIDGDFGYSESDDYYSDSWKGGLLVGGGLSVGREFDLGNQMQFVIGGSAGIWVTSNWEEYRYYYNGQEYNNYKRNYSCNFLATFVKWRWSPFEITYRGLLGIYEQNEDGYRYGSYYDDYGDEGFGYNSHQLMVGFHFGGRKAK